MPVSLDQILTAARGRLPALAADRALLERGGTGGFLVFKDPARAQNTVIETRGLEMRFGRAGLRRGVAAQEAHIPRHRAGAVAGAGLTDEQQAGNVRGLGGIDDERGHRGEVLGAAFYCIGPLPLALADIGTGEQLGQRKNAGQRRADLVRDSGKRGFDRARLALRAQTPRRGRLFAATCRPRSARRPAGRAARARPRAASPLPRPRGGPAAGAARRAAARRGRCSSARGRPPAR